MFIANRVHWRGIRQLESLKTAVAAVRAGWGPCRVSLHPGADVDLKRARIASGPTEAAHKLACALAGAKYWAAEIDLVVVRNAVFLPLSSTLVFPNNGICDELEYSTKAAASGIWLRGGEPRQINRWQAKQMENAEFQSGVHLLIHPKWHHIYTHWFTEAMVALYDPRIDRDVVDYVCVPGGPKYELDSLALAGEDASKLKVLREPAYRLEIAVFPTHLLARTMVHPAAAPALRLFADKALKHVAPMPKKYIYLSREDAKARSMRNEGALASALCDLGFTKLIATDLSFQEQVQAFSSASALVSPHGSGLTNMLFAPKNAHILELRPRYAGDRGELWDRSYHILADLLGLPYSLLVFENEKGEEGWDVDVDFAVNKVKEFMSRVDEKT